MSFNTFCNICLKSEHLIKLCKEENEKVLTILISLTLCPDVINNNIIYLCTMCIEKLEDFDRFRKMCFTNLIYFRNLYKQMKKKLEILNDSDIEIKLKKFVEVNVHRPPGSLLLDNPAHIDVAAMALKKNSTILNGKCLKNQNEINNIDSDRIFESYSCSDSNTSNDRNEQEDLGENIDCDEKEEISKNFTLEKGVSFHEENDPFSKTGVKVLSIPSCSASTENVYSEINKGYAAKVSKENCTITAQNNLLGHDSCEKTNEIMEHEEEEICEEPSEISRNENLYECTECGKTFSQIRNLKVHQLVHSGKKTYKCDLCEKEFTFAHNLKTHHRIHTAEKPYECSQCQKKFTTKSQLNVHEVIHTGVRAYKCSICKKAFARLGDKTIHEQIHSDKRPFECLKCDKKFSTRRSLRQHQPIHTGQKPFKCGDCKKAFRRSAALKVHERIHNGERPYKCSNCEETFVYPQHLKKHQQLCCKSP